MAYISSYAVISMMTMVIPVYMWQRWRQIGIKSAVATADRLLMTSINFYGPQNIIYIVNSMYVIIAIKELVSDRNYLYFQIN